MATALISQTQKNTIKSIIDDIHETFARTITVFKEGKKVLIDIDQRVNVTVDGNENVSGEYKLTSGGGYAQIGGPGSLSVTSSEVSLGVFHFRWTLIDGSDGSPNVSSSLAADIQFTPWAADFSGTIVTVTQIVKGSRFNGVYGRNISGKKTTTKTVVQHTLKARIKYESAREQNLADGKINSQLDIDLIDGSVRITVDSDGFEILKEAKRCEFEGRKYTINSKGNPTGIFGPQYYHFYLLPIEE